MIPDPERVLDLPKGFSYKELSAEGRPIAPGVVVPGHHDGTATFPGSDRHTTRLVRNHEQDMTGTRAVAPPELTYDPAVWGGTTALEVDEHGTLLSQRVSLARTVRNCAGRRTPWGTTFRHVRWVKVPDPSAAKTSTRAQFDTITRSQKLEGAWWSGGAAYFVASFAPGGRFDGPEEHHRLAVQRRRGPRRGRRRRAVPRRHHASGQAVRDRPQRLQRRA
jgi:hypothetical protein